MHALEVIVERNRIAAERELSERGLPDPEEQEFDEGGEG